MDQFRQIGEVVGSLKALMVLKHEIVVNQRQCCFIFDVFVQAFDQISDEIKQNLRLDERSAKWTPLERPLRELHRVFKEGESYIKGCIDIKNWLGKAVSLHLNNDCVELHVHNVLSCFVVVIEAIEAAAEIAGLDEEQMQKRRLALLKKSCDAECNDPKLFQWKYGDQYLVSRETCVRLEGVWREDKWLLLEMLRQKKKKQTKLADALINKLNGSDNNKLLPTSLLLESNDYHVKRRIGSAGSHLKEIQWLGESFGLRTFYGDAELLRPEIDMVMSMCHPNVLQYHCGFYDEERKEGFLVMEAMSKSLDILIKENSGQRKRMSFSIPVAVDLMLQVARGMEYLHSRSVCHGELNPSNVLLRPTSSSSGECYFHVKVGGFGLSLLKSQYTHRSCPRPGAVDSLVWCAPEVVAEKAADVAKCSEKADVYSFGMLCFQILTGKAPFEEWERPLQGDKMMYSLMAGERPLFPHPFPKYLITLIKKCWQTSPTARPSFSSICRILRYMKKVLIINPDHGQPGCPPPLVDYCDIEDGYTKKFHKDGVLPAVSEIPFEMFAYKLVEKEKTSRNDVICDPGEHLVSLDDLCVVPNDGSHRRSACSEIIDRKDLGTYADQRSVLSEIAYSKPSLADHISILSDDETSAAFADTPDWKLLSALPKSHSMSATGSINKFKFSESAQKKQPVAERKRMCSEILGKKDSTPKRVFTAEPKPTRPDEASEKTSSAAGKKVGDIQTPVHSESTRKKFLSNMKAKFKLTKIPEKKTLSSITARSPASPDNPHKATTSNPRKSLKNAIFNNTVKGKQPSNEAAGTTQRYRSPGASPARVTRTNSLGRFSSPLSSPLHPSKAFSPARVPPSRSLNSCPSPSLRAIKDKPRESFMSPRRQMKVI